MAGIGVERIAHLAGLSVSHIRELAEHSRGDTRETRRVRPDTATRILGIGMNDASRAPHSRVDATRIRRRLHALIAIGWPAELLAAQLGRRPNSVHRSMTGESVTARTAHDVATLYERLWSTRPPRDTRDQRAAADAARAHAAAHGWLPPLAWDDIDTDPHPRARPPDFPGGTTSTGRRGTRPSPATTSPTTTSPQSSNKRSFASSAPAAGPSATSLPGSARPSEPFLDGAHPAVRHDHQVIDRSELLTILGTPNFDLRLPCRTDKPD
ncbi:MAG TPA: hypothetical protein VE823_08100 [Geodermatophilus sp.]|nr:hypothetical protein [Geodermatophilus sp.]